MPSRAGEALAASGRRGSREASKRTGKRFGERSSSSRRRAEEAQAWVEREITKLLVVVVEIADDDRALGEHTGEYAVSFETLYHEYEVHADSASGVLTRARRRGLVEYDGQGQLFHGRDDGAIVRLTRKGVQRAKAWQRENANVRQSVRLSMRQSMRGGLFPASSRASQLRQQKLNALASDLTSPSRPHGPLKRKARSHSSIVLVNPIIASSAPAPLLSKTAPLRSKSLEPRPTAGASSAAEDPARISENRWQRFDPRPTSVRLQPELRRQALNRANTADSSSGRKLTFSAYDAPKDQGKVGNSATSSQTPNLMRFLSAPPQRTTTFGYPDPKEALGDRASGHLQTSQTKLTTLRRSLTRSFSENRRSATNLIRRLSMQRSSSEPHRTPRPVPDIAQDYDEYEEEEENDLDGAEARHVTSSTVAQAGGRQAGDSRANLDNVVEEEEEEDLEPRHAEAAMDSDLDGDMYDEGEEEPTLAEDGDDYEEDEDPVVHEPLVPRGRERHRTRTMAASEDERQEVDDDGYRAGRSPRSSQRSTPRLSWRRNRDATAQSPRNRYSRFRGDSSASAKRRWSQRRSRRRFDEKSFAGSETHGRSAYGADNNNDARSDRGEDDYEMPSCSDGVMSMVSLAGNKLAEGAAGFADGIAEGASNWRASRRFSSGSSYASSASERGYYTARSQDA